VDELTQGLYEVLVTEGLRARLDALGDARPVTRRALHPAEAADRIAWHLGREIERALADVDEQTRAAVGIGVARALLARLGELVELDPAVAPVEPATVLHAVTGRRPDGSPEPVTEPLTPLLDTTLLTNAPGEPNLWNQLRSEIDSADGIDVVMAFIRRSGIAPLLDALRRHADRGRPLRVLTTTYTGSTEQAALDRLAELGADVRVSYDLGTTRLHAKAWVFHRRSGFSTAYVGSSNLTHAAQVTGLEWNVRASAARNPDLIAKFTAVFDSYWSGGDFVAYDPAEFEQQAGRAGGIDRGPHVILSPIELRPHPFQDRLLELLELSRQRGHHHNLLVAATGTGKTVMAALDYARLRDRLGRARLLFVAHRAEILDQSLATFRHALRDPSFGERWVGGSRPTRFEHVFASIQSLDAAGTDSLPADHFDVVVVDEFHHAAAPSYRRLLDHVRPVELLGLTATPERSDGLPILQWFDDRIAAELRLWDAIDQQHLAPFQYYGIHDGTDLRDVPWRRGRGYDVDALSNRYTGDDAWARLVVKQVIAHVDVGAMRALGFCVSVEHARFMARHFTRHGIPSVAVWGDSPAAEREAALRDLAAGTVRVVFSVDLFNLGRGLRRAPGKTVCTVLDFVGQHRKEFRYDRRFRALLGGTRRDLERQIADGFPFLPAGCHMELDRVASRIVLENVRQAAPARWAARVAELRAMVGGGADVSLGAFLAETGLELEEFYASSRSWSELRAAAGLTTAAEGPKDRSLLRGCGRLLHVDDRRRLAAYRRFLGERGPLVVDSLSATDRRLLQMLVASIADKAVTKTTALGEAYELLRAHPKVCEEMLSILDVLEARMSHATKPLDSRRDVPLEVHARYSRLEILAAFGLREGAKMPPWQTGVYWAEAAKADLLAFTLDKTSGGFSPTTRYRDYALSRDLIHWESQGATRSDSKTGLRYQHHVRDGSAIMLFARLHADDRAFWFLGPATYVKHESQQPMAITWRLAHALPADLYTAFAAAVA